MRGDGLAGSGVKRRALVRADFIKEIKGKEG
jgi:hypothetical protein